MMRENVCTEQMRYPYTEYTASGLPNPTRLEGDMICPGTRPAGVSYTQSKIVVECLLTRSMLIKIYIHDIYKYLQSLTPESFS